MLEENVKLHIEGRNESVQLTQFDYFCYKINSTVTQPPKQSGQWQISGEINVNEVGRIPNNSNVYLTSEKNSNGKFFNEWWEGNVLEQMVNVLTQSEVTVGIRPVEHFYLDHDDQCSHETNFDKYKARIPANYNFSARECQVTCTPVHFFLDSFPHCGWDYEEDYYDIECVENDVFKHEWKEFKEEIGYKRPCHILEYEGGKLFEEENHAMCIKGS